jgi:hypothetical protein
MALANNASRPMSHHTRRACLFNRKRRPMFSRAFKKEKLLRHLEKSPHKSLESLVVQAIVRNGGGGYFVCEIVQIGHIHQQQGLE